MGDTPRSPTMLPQLQRIATQAERYPEMVFNNLYHLIDYDLLAEAYRRTRKDAARVDKVTAQDYGDDLEANLRDCTNDCARTAIRSPR